jgi:hypothetical protein
MAKKAKAIPAGQLGDWQDEIPEEVQKCADAYDSAHTAKSKAQAKLNTAKDSLIESMKANNCPRVRIRSGEKFLVLDVKDGVRYEKPKEPTAKED